MLGRSAYLYLLPADTLTSPQKSQIRTPKWWQQIKEVLYISLCTILCMLLIVAAHSCCIRAADQSIIQYGELMFDEQSSCGQALMNGGRAV